MVLLVQDHGILLETKEEALMSKSTKARGAYPNRPELKNTLEQKGIRYEESETERGWPFYGGRKEVGTLAFFLPGWRYPVVVADNGDATWDNWNGQWGDFARYREVLEPYVTAVADQFYASKGRRRESVIEEREEDGTLVLTYVQ